MVGLLRAFDAGRGSAFARGFDRAADFEPYNGSSFALKPALKPGGHITRSDIARYVQSRHRAGDGWTGVVLLPPQRRAHPPNDAIYGLALTVRLGSQTQTGRGAKIVIDCDTGLVRVWLGPVVHPAG
jgi:hypothetical protein